MGLSPASRSLPGTLHCLPNRPGSEPGDHIDGLVLPEKFKGTEVEEITTLLKKKVIWHQPGTLDKEDARDVIFTLNRLVIAIDRELGIADAGIGEFR